jgi:hypothetical protein
MQDTKFIPCANLSLRAVFIFPPILNCEKFLFSHDLKKILIFLAHLWMNDSSFLWPTTLREALLKITINQKKLTVSLENILNKTGHCRKCITPAKGNFSVPYQIDYSGNFLLRYILVFEIAVGPGFL